MLSGSPSSNASRTAALRDGLRAFGYVEQKNIIIDYRYAEGKMDRFPVLAAELVRLKPDVLVTSGSLGIRALMRETESIPIVMAAIGDAVGSRFVKSLAQPGGNATGLSFLEPDVGTKRLEILKESLPRVSLVAVLRHSASGKRSLDATLAAAHALKLKVQVFEVKGSNEFEGVLVNARKAEDKRKR